MLAIAIVVFFYSITRSRGQGVFANKFSLKPQIGGQMPVETPLKDEDGKDVSIGKYLQSTRPVMLLPIFYKCNGVCYTELDSLTKMLIKEAAVSTKKTVDSVLPGRDFDVVIVSIHPKETPDLARAKKAEIMGLFSEGWKKLSPQDQERLYTTLESGMHFTTGKPEDVRKLTEAMGFEYTYDEGRDWVNHPAAAAFLSGGGKIVAYNTGPNFATVTVRAAVKDAKLGNVEPLGDVFLLGCFKMEATSPRTRSIVQILNISAVFTALLTGFAIYKMNKRFPNNPISSGGPQA